MAITFHFQNQVRLNERRHLKKYLSDLLRLYKKQAGNISITFCSDDYLLDINQRFLSHDYYTDIITFDLSVAESLDADIYISVDRVRDNSIKLNTDFNIELHRVIFHGLLHLCGFGDKSKTETTIMRSLEEKHLNKYFNVPRET